ncbi:dual-specificity protein kinase [Novymonas esmeraldas]|uniref:dual-specificity kinase n=1 Tax=Novymonas esmeraldas TaxID=1808958 RepID=A0AAW0FAZ8_9TRYP
MHLTDAQSTSGVSSISASEALRRYGSFLTPYERKEILHYEAIHYAGQRCADKVRAPIGGPNDGYDTEEGEYSFRAKDHIAYRYEVVEELGSGAFGQVFKAVDHADGSVVAVKLIRNQRKVLQQAEQEVSILQRVNDRDPKRLYGIVRMTDNFTFRGHICISYELLGANLYEYLKAKDFFPMSLSVIRSIAARLLVALTFLARENIMHCDLKPENILLRDSDPSVVKVVDLGSASLDEKNSYMYIQSRFYRAPEVIMEQRYNKAIDWWSFGCILCELANGDPVFPGEDEKDQLGCIMEYLGPPPASFVQASSARRRREFFDEQHAPRPRKSLKGKLREPGSRSLAKFLAVPEDDDFLSFVRLFLQWDPSQRVTPREAMRHRWICGEFVFPTRAVEKRLDSTPAAEDGSGAAAQTEGSTVAHHVADQRPPKGSPSSPTVAATAPTIHAGRGAAPQGEGQTATLPPPFVARTGGAPSNGTTSEDALRASTVPQSRDASTTTTTAARSAAQSTGAHARRPTAPHRHNGRQPRGRQRRSTAMTDVEMPSSATASPNHSTSLHSGVEAPEMSEESLAGRSMVVAAAAPSPNSARSAAVSARSANAKPRELRAMGTVLSPTMAVLSPIVLRTAASPVHVVPRGANPHPSEGSMQAGAVRSDAVKNGPVSAARPDNSGAVDARRRVTELRQKYESNTTKADALVSHDRGGGSGAFSGLPRWSNTAGGAGQGTGEPHVSVSLSRAPEASGSVSPRVSPGSPKGRTGRGRREYSLNLDAGLSPYETMRTGPHTKDYMLVSELPPSGDCGASASAPYETEAAPDARRPAVKAPQPRGKGAVPLRALPRMQDSSPPPQAAADYTLRQRSAHGTVLATRDVGAVGVGRPQCAAVSAAEPTAAGAAAVDRRVAPSNGVRPIPPRQILGQRVQLSPQRSAGAREGDAIRQAPTIAPTATPQLPPLKNNSVH